ncbi:MAG: hypothetical protein PVG01_01070, partial [Desulfobacterales bacterium]
YSLINRKGGVTMQQRFCTCGFPVWVQYLLSEMNCGTIFWSTVYRSGRVLTRCPSCGRALHIDDLS